MAIRHFLTLFDFTPQELQALIQRAVILKKMTQKGERYTPFLGKMLTLIFEKSSTRTRVAFEVAIAQLGGHAVFLSPRDTQLGRGEPIEDTARVVSRMTDIVAIRTAAHDHLERFSAYSQVPVINALSDDCHPCQLLADMQTYLECRGEIKGKTVAWVGDGFNMCHSYIVAACQFDFHLRIAVPEGYDPNPVLLEKAGDRVKVFRDPQEAVSHADLVTTDVWTSMGQEEETQKRCLAFTGYQVTPALMQRAKSDAIFLHCLPAHRGEEVAVEVIDGPQSFVWDQAENRLHTQKALLEFLLMIR